MRSSLRSAPLALLLVAAPVLAQAGPAPEVDLVDEPAAQAVDPMPVFEPEPERVLPPYEELVRSNYVGVMTRSLTGLLRSGPSPLPEDFASVAAAFTMLQRLEPDNETLMRLRHASWFAAEELDEAASVTREILRVRPDDQVAQLQLLTHRISKLEDADARLEMYDRVLSSAGDGLPNPVRSRLALDAALLERERGDDTAFLERLTLATALDVTNKEAAALYATVVLDRTSDPRERVDILLNVILADPFDAAAHLNLSQELMRRGAYSSAFRFFQLYERINRLEDRDPTPEEVFDQSLLLWHVLGPQQALQLINSAQRADQMKLDERRQELIDDGVDMGDSRPLALLPTRLETMRLALFTVKGETALAESSLVILERLFLEDSRAFLDPARAPRDMSQAERDRRVRELELPLLAAKLWSGLRVDEAMQTLREKYIDAEGGPFINRRAIDRFEGLAAAHRGEPDRAMQLLEPLADSDPLARLGMAIAAERAGQLDQALFHYARLALDYPRTLFAAAGRTTIELIRGRPLVPDDATAELDAYANEIAPWLARVISNPYNAQDLKVEHTLLDPHPLERPEVVVRLRNVSRWPLALGPQSPISSRFVLAPVGTIEGRDAPALMVPEVLELHQRLRLEPDERLEVRVWPTRGWMGTFLQFYAIKGITLRWRLIQGFRLDDDRILQPGAFAVSARTAVMRPKSLGDPPSDDEIIRLLLETQDTEFLESFLLAHTAIVDAFSRPNDARKDEVLRVFGPAFSQRLPTLDEFARAWMIAKLHRGPFFRREAHERFIEDLGEDASRWVLLVRVMVHANDPGDPAFSLALASGDEDLERAARARRSALQQRRAAAEEDVIVGPIP
ncbi:MAG: hypothetical protein AAGD00_03465 [Planctomycetota bacterium]